MVADVLQSRLLWLSWAILFNKVFFGVNALLPGPNFWTFLSGLGFVSHRKVWTFISLFIIVVDFFFQLFKFRFESFDLNDVSLRQGLYLFVLTLSLLPQVRIFVFEVIDLLLFFLQLFAILCVLPFVILSHFLHHFNHLLQLGFILCIVEQLLINVVTFPYQQFLLSFLALSKFLLQKWYLLLITFIQILERLL